MSILWPLDTVRVTGEWANSPWYYQQFGQRGHNGIDLAASVGTPVYAADSGTIAFEGWGQNHSWMGSIAGISALIRHGWGYSGYAHLSSTIVNAGQYVKRGQLIGYSGATGVGTGPHLHFETFPLNPNFGNGFAGRVNPRAWGLVPRNSTQKPPAPKPPTKNPNPKPKKRKKSMASLYYTSSNDKRAGKGGTGVRWYLAGDSPGTDANWLPIFDQQLANELAEQHGKAVFLSRATAESWKSKYLQPVKTR